MWDADTGLVSRKLAAHDGEVLAVTYSDDGRLLATWDGPHVRVWSSAGELLSALPHEEIVLEATGNPFFDTYGTKQGCLAFSTDGRLVALASPRAGFPLGSGKRASESARRRRVKTVRIAWPFRPTARAC
jgi:WD40 repeat protein